MVLGCHGIDVMHGYQTVLTDKQLQVIKNMPGLQKKSENIHCKNMCDVENALPKDGLSGVFSLA